MISRKISCLFTKTISRNFFFAGGRGGGRGGQGGGRGGHRGGQHHGGGGHHADRGHQRGGYDDRRYDDGNGKKNFVKTTHTVEIAEILSHTFLANFVKVTFLLKS